jgi:hypothetical protein
MQAVFFMGGRRVLAGSGYGLRMYLGPRRGDILRERETSRALADIWNWLDGVEIEGAPKASPVFP